MITPLTAKQSQVLVFITAFSTSNGFPPTIREIGDHFHIAPPSALSHLRALERKGFIRRMPSKPRCLEVIIKNGSKI